MYQAVTSTPTALAGLSANRWYFVQNTGTARVRVALTTSAPERGARDSFVIPPDGSLNVRLETGESAYVWAPDLPSGVTHEAAE